ncbi:hypothetical protein C0992_004547 [Termitomyces sp. T32_za158]|nr:hypothetical protein C0992_004547 [Termitomyces sp. T32_za158]
MLTSLLQRLPLTALQTSLDRYIFAPETRPKRLVTQPNASSEPNAYSNWLSNNDLIIGIIHAAISDAEQEGLDTDGSAKECYDALKARAQNKGPVRSPNPLAPMQLLSQKEHQPTPTTTVLAMPAANSALILDSPAVGIQNNGALGQEEIQLESTKTDTEGTKTTDFAAITTTHSSTKFFVYQGFMATEADTNDASNNFRTSVNWDNHLINGREMILATTMIAPLNQLKCSTLSSLNEKPFYLDSSATVNAADYAQGIRLLA